MGEVEDIAAEFEEVFDHAQECRRILQRYAGRKNGATTIFRPPVVTDLIDLARHCRQGWAIYDQYWKKFARLHEHPVTFAGVTQVSYHCVAFMLPRFALTAVRAFVFPDISGGDGTEFDWAQVSSDSRISEGTTLMALQSSELQRFGIQPADFLAYARLNAGLEHEEAVLSREDGRPSRDNWQWPLESQLGPLTESLTKACLAEIFNCGRNGIDQKWLAKHEHCVDENKRPKYRLFVADMPPGWERIAKKHRPKQKKRKRVPLAAHSGSG